MEIFYFSVGIIIGVISSLLFIFFYIRIATNDRKTVFNKLPIIFIKALLDDPRSRLTSKELSSLIKEIEIDPIPFKACPECGSTFLKIDFTESNTCHRLDCEDCGWTFRSPD